jgi:hypothetical protein
MWTSARPPAPSQPTITTPGAEALFELERPETRCSHTCSSSREAWSRHLPYASMAPPMVRISSALYALGFPCESACMQCTVLHVLCVLLRLPDDTPAYRKCHQIRVTHSGCLRAVGQQAAASTVPCLPASAPGRGQRGGAMHPGFLCAGCVPAVALYKQQPAT